MQCVLSLLTILGSVYCFSPLEDKRIVPLKMMEHHPHQDDHHLELDKRSLHLKMMEHHPVLSDAWTQVEHPQFLLVSKTPDLSSTKDPLQPSYENIGPRLNRSTKYPR